MLVIRRRAGESFFVGEEVEIELLEIEGSQVKIGIRAPRTVVILRREVRSAQRANLSAARHDLPPSLATLVERLR